MTYYRFLLLLLIHTTLLSGINSCDNTASPAKEPTLSLQTRKLNEKGEHIYESKVFNPATTAVLVVDMWHHGGLGYIRPDSSFVGSNEGYFYLSRVADSLNETLSAIRSLGITVIHTPAEQAHLYEDHPARQNIKKMARVPYPWREKPGWNDDQKKIPFSTFPYEYEYAYPNTPKERNRPGTKAFGQIPEIGIAETDYLTEDVEELWNLLEQKGIETLIYMGGSTNMCLPGRPYGLLNMQKYGKQVLMDRNYAHLVHRVPHGWNGNMHNPEYGPFHTNERHGGIVVAYFESNICATIDGMDFRKLAQAKGGYKVAEAPVKQAVPDKNNFNLSFQTQMIEIAGGYIVDIGWEYTRQPNGWLYGWNRFKMKDAIREGYDPVSRSYILARAGDTWKMADMARYYNGRLELKGTGELLLNGRRHRINHAERQPLIFEARHELKLEVKSGELKLYQLSVSAH